MPICIHVHILQLMSSYRNIQFQFIATGFFLAFLKSIFVSSLHIENWLPTGMMF